MQTCKNCPKRYLGCHDCCPDFAEHRKILAEIKLKQHKENVFAEYQNTKNSVKLARKNRKR